MVQVTAFSSVTMKEKEDGERKEESQEVGHFIDWQEPEQPLASGLMRQPQGDFNYPALPQQEDSTNG